MASVASPNLVCGPAWLQPMSRGHRGRKRRKSIGARGINTLRRIRKNVSSFDLHLHMLAGTDNEGICH